MQTWPSPRAIPHTTNPENDRNGIKRSQSQSDTFVKGVDPKFLSNMCFAKKHKVKGLQNMKAVSVCAEDFKDFVKLKVAKAKTPKTQP